MTFIFRITCFVRHYAVHLHRNQTQKLDKIPMITNADQLAKLYELQSPYELFDYIGLLYTNGQLGQCRGAFWGLNTMGRSECMAYLQEAHKGAYNYLLTSF